MEFSRFHPSLGFKQARISLSKNSFREAEYQLCPSLPGDFCLMQCLLLYRLRNKLVLDHPNANLTPPTSVLLAPQVEYWTVIA